MLFFISFSCVQFI